MTDSTYYYYVQFRACPTNYNPVQHLMLSAEELREYVHITNSMGGRAEFTVKGLRERNLDNGSGYVIGKIYTESDAKIVQYYEYGYGKAKITEKLRQLLSAPKPVVGADDIEGEDQ